MTRNGIIVSYRVEFIDNAVDDVNTTNTSVIIGMLEKFTSYRVRVFATTVAEGNGSVIVEVTTDEDSEYIYNHYVSLGHTDHDYCKSWVYAVY